MAILMGQGRKKKKPRAFLLLEYRHIKVHIQNDFVCSKISKMKWKVNQEYKDTELKTTVTGHDRTKH